MFSKIRGVKTVSCRPVALLLCLGLLFGLASQAEAQIAPVISPRVPTLEAEAGSTIGAVGITLNSGDAADRYSIAPAIANGLVFSTVTGAISGTPTAIAAAVTYTITAINAGGSGSTTVTITVGPGNPTVSASVETLTVPAGIPITPVTFTLVSGSPADSYEILPAITNGLTFSTTTGTISGTPLAVAAAVAYRIFAKNVAGTRPPITVTITVTASTTTADAGPDQSVAAGVSVTLDGSGSSDSEGDTLTYAWTQTSGTDVTLSSTTTVAPTFTAPTDGVRPLVFSLTVTNASSGSSLVDTVTVTVTVVPVITPRFATLTGKVNSPIPAVTITSSGGAVDRYSIAPDIATTLGLAFSTSTGTISGTPTAVGVVEYTITATNAGGSGTTMVTITVEPGSPVISASVETLTTIAGIPIVPVTVTLVSGSPADSYEILPAITNGLAFSTSTGTISGTPLAVAAAVAYRISARNAGGTRRLVTVTITITPPAPPVISASVSTLAANVGSPITPVTFTLDSGGAIASYSIAPAIGNGLTFSITTSTISGTPTAVADAVAYTITATNAFGSGSTMVTITVDPAVLPVISASVPTLSATAGTAITPVTITLDSGSAIASYSIAPDIPSSLAFSTSTGTISGTPTAVAGAVEYTITATNGAGSGTTTVTITVNNPAAPIISASVPTLTATVGTAIPPVSITSTSGGEVARYSIMPTIANGLTFSISTGTISGTPTAVAVEVSYTITATNLGGSGTAMVTITVNNPAAPIITANPSEQTATVGTAIDPVTITSTSGGTVRSYSIAPAIANGLTFDTTSGTISGTPTAVAVEVSYTITATNAGGSDDATVAIVVNPAPVAPTLTNFAAVLTGLEVALSWDVDDSGSDITGYTLTRTSGSDTVVTITVASTTVTMLTDTVTAAGDYEYSLKATNGEGDSNIATVMVTAAPVGDLAPDHAIEAPVGSIQSLTIPFSEFVPAVSGNTFEELTITFSLHSDISFLSSLFTGFTGATPTGALTAANNVLTVTGNSVVITTNFGADYDDPIPFDYTVTNTDGASASGVITITFVNTVIANPFTVTLTTDDLSGSRPIDLAISRSDFTDILFDGTVFTQLGVSVFTFTTNGTGDAGGTLTVTDPTFTFDSGGNEFPVFHYTPVSGFVGTETFDYTASYESTSDTSTISIVVPAAIAPTLTNFAAVPTNLEVQLSWTVDNGGSDITGYTLTRTSGSDTTDVTITPPPAVGVTTFTDTVPAEGVYTYSLIATNDAGNSPAVTAIARDGSEEQVAAVVSEVARAIVSSTVSAVTSRISNVASGLAGAQVGGVNLNDANMASALTANAQAFASNSDAMKTLLGNSDISFPLNAAGDNDGSGSSVAVWASGEYSELSGESDDLDWEGELTGFHLGMDGKIRTSGDKNILIGVALSSLNGDLDYEDETAAGSTEKGNYEIGMTTISPYVGWRAGVVDLWASVGFGEGEVELTDNKDIKSTSDAEQTSFAIGGSGVVRTKGSYNLRVKGELSASQFDIEDSDDTNTTTPAIAKATLDTSRARLSIEASTVRPLENGRAFEKSAEIGARFDGGDGQTGAGVEIGGQLKYVNSVIGFTVEGSARVLLGHSGDYEEWGIQGTIRKQVGRDGQGLAFYLTPAYGDVNSGVAELLAQGLNDDVADNTADPDYRMNLTSRLGYGIAYRGMVTPYTEIALGTTDQYRMGVNWKPNQTFNLTLLGEQTKQNIDTENSIRLQGSINF